MKISAFYLAEQIQLKPLKESYAGTLLQENPSELFYRVDEDKYFHAFGYGAVAFANMSDTDISQSINLLGQFLKNPLPEKIRDDIEISVAENSPLTFHFDSLTVPRLDESVVKIVLFNTAQSVTMDFFAERADTLLAEIQQFTSRMEDSGTISISRKNMLKFIGRTLNNKNRIVENLFIFDSPEVTWDDDYLDKIHRGLVRTFELQSRFKEIEYTFKIIEDNLTVFRELYLHKESSKLEWIIIFLICIEVFDLIISKLT
ncbi:MAG: RMD1 family protein [Saprospiraceae bacterium]